MKLYHQTWHGMAERLVAGGWLDALGIGFVVWITEAPLAEKGDSFETLLEVELSEGLDLAEYRQTDGPPHEYLIPTEVLHQGSRAISVIGTRRAATSPTTAPAGCRYRQDEAIRAPRPA